MKCPYCRNQKTKVIDKRDNHESNNTRRRRECEECNRRFTTYERIENVLLTVEKRNGKREEFDREKLKRGIMKAINKRHIPDNKVEELLDKVEQELLMRRQDTIKSTEIGDIVLRKLSDLDELGAFLFAAVYKEFETLEDVRKALKKEDG